MRRLLVLTMTIALAMPAFAASRGEVEAALRSGREKGYRGQRLARHLASTVRDPAFSSPYRNSWLTSPYRNSWLTSPYRDSPVTSPYYSSGAGADYVLRHAAGQ